MEEAAWVENGENAIRTATEAHRKKVRSYANAITRPIVVFKEATTLGRVGIGAAFIGSAVATEFAVKFWRNSGEQSHIGRLEAERVRHLPSTDIRQFLYITFCSTCRLTSSEYFCLLGRHNGLRILKKSAKGPDVGGVGLS